MKGRNNKTAKQERKERWKEKEKNGGSKEGREGERKERYQGVIVSPVKDEGGVCKTEDEMKICSLPSPYPSVPKPSDKSNFSYLGNSHFLVLLTLFWMRLTRCLDLRVVSSRLKLVIDLILH